jgi:hypothetical protein
MYNEEAVIDFLRAELVRFMGEVSAEVELILVNDGSTDRTIDKVASWAVEDRRIKVIHLSRNFGHQIASTAGLDYAAGSSRAVLASLLGWYSVPGWTSLMVVTSIVGSALLISVGILGQYLGKIYEQSKDRSLYLVSRTFNIAPLLSRRS